MPRILPISLRPLRPLVLSASKIGRVDLAISSECIAIVVDSWRILSRDSSRSGIRTIMYRHKRISWLKEEIYLCGLNNFFMRRFIHRFITVTINYIPIYVYTASRKKMNWNNLLHLSALLAISSERAIRNIQKLIISIHVYLSRTDDHVESSSVRRAHLHFCPRLFVWKKSTGIPDDARRCSACLKMHVRFIVCLEYLIVSNNGLKGLSLGKSYYI